MGPLLRRIGCFLAVVSEHGGRGCGSHGVFKFCYCGVIVVSRIEKVLLGPSQRGLGVGSAQRQQAGVRVRHAVVGEEPQAQLSRAAALLADGQPPSLELGQERQAEPSPVEDP